MCSTTEGNDTCIEISASCDGVFTYEKRAPAKHVEDRYSSEDITANPLFATGHSLPDGADRFFHHHHSHNDWAKDGFSFNNCEGQWFYMIVKAEDEARHEADRPLERQDPAANSLSDESKVESTILLCVGDLMAITSVDSGVLSAASEYSLEQCVCCLRAAPFVSWCLLSRIYTNMPLKRNTFGASFMHKIFALVQRPCRPAGRN